MADNTVLNNINGEYVKFYYTTNSILPQTLKRTGAIVIYDNKNFHKQEINSYDLSYNSIYLGGELIIGGIGFSDLNSRKKAIEILGEWDEFKSYTVGKFSYLNDKIINALNVDLSGTETKVSGDNLIDINNKKEIYINQAVFDTIETQYKPAEILSEENEIKYFDLGNYGRDKNNYITVSSYNNEPIDIPIGAKISSVTKRIKVKLNDDTLSYISGSYIYYDNDNWEEFLNNTYYNGADVKLHVTNNETISNNDIAHIELTYIYNENSNSKYYVSEIPNQKILTYNSLWFTGTYLNNSNIIKELSYYDVKTERVEKTGIKSIKNVVLEHRHLLNDIIINPKPFIFYYNKGTNIINSYTMFNDGYRKILSDKIVDLLISKDATKFIFAIPKGYTINNIYYYENYNNMNVKTNITSLFVKLDIKQLNGDTQNTVKTSFINLYFDREYILKNRDYNFTYYLDTNNRFCEYDFYSMDFGNNETFNSDVRIYIEFDNFPYENITLLSPDNIQTSYNGVKNPIILNFDKSNNSNNWMMLHNDMYLSSNWISNIDTENYDNILGYKLKYLAISNDDYTDDKIFNNEFNVNNLNKYYNDNKYSHEMPVFNIDNYGYYKYFENDSLNVSDTPHLILDEAFCDSVYIYDRANNRLDIEVIKKYVGNYIFTKFYELNLDPFKENNGIKFELLKFVSFDIIDTSLQTSREVYKVNKENSLRELKYKFLNTNNKLGIEINDDKVANNYFIPRDFSSNEYKLYTNLKEKLDELMQSNEQTANLGKYSLYMIIPRSIPLNIKFNYKKYNFNTENNPEIDNNPEIENFRTKYIYLSNFVYKNVKYNIYEFTGDLDYKTETSGEITRYILDNITISKK